MVREFQFNISSVHWIFTHKNSRVRHEKMKGTKFLSNKKPNFFQQLIHGFIFLVYEPGIWYIEI
jgi:hypothetical protein